MRRIFAITAIAAIGVALGGCTGDPTSGFDTPPSNALAYEPPGAVSRTPLAPPSGYAGQPGYGPSPSYGGGQSYGAPPPGGYAPPPPGYSAQAPAYAPPPSGGYVPPPPASGFGPPPSADSRPLYPPASAPYGNGYNPGYNPYGSTYSNGSYPPRSAAVGGWQTSPRWSAVQGNGCVIVEQDGGASGTRVRNCANAPHHGQSAVAAPRTQPGADAADDAPVDVPSRGDDAGGY